MNRTRGIVLLAVAAAGLALFVVLGLGALGSRPNCTPSERCLERTFEAIDPPLLWVLPLGAGIAGAAGLRLLRQARTAPPQRAPDATWEDFAGCGSGEAN